MMVVTELTDSERNEWDEYVRTSANGMPLHLSGWQEVLRATYGYETHFLLVRDETAADPAAIAGVMPMFLVQSRLTGHRAVTMPGGICADDGGAAATLAAEATQIAQSRGAQRVHVQDARQTWLNDFQTVNGHVGWVVDVRGTEDERSKRLHRNVRRQIRKAGENGLHTAVDRSGELVDDFYHVLSRFTHQAGTPVYGRDFLENVVRNLSNNFSIVVVYLNKTPIGGYFQLEMGDSVYGMWGATLHEYLQLRPVYLAYWAILADAAEHGFSYVDMGRSPTDSNASKFKKQWGGEPVSIYQQTLSLDGQPAASMTERTQSDGPMRSFMQIWPKVPFPVAQYLGPKLRRHVPFA